MGKRHQFGFHLGGVETNNNQRDKTTGSLFVPNKPRRMRISEAPRSHGPVLLPLLVPNLPLLPPLLATAVRSSVPPPPPASTLIYLVSRHARKPVFPLLATGASSSISMRRMGRLMGGAIASPFAHPPPPNLFSIFYYREVSAAAATTFFLSAPVGIFSPSPTYRADRNHYDYGKFVQ